MSDTSLRDKLVSEAYTLLDFNSTLKLYVLGPEISGVCSRTNRPEDAPLPVPLVTFGRRLLSLSVSILLNVVEVAITHTITHLHKAIFFIVLASASNAPRLFYK